MIIWKEIGEMGKSEAAEKPCEIYLCKKKGVK